MYGYFSYYPAFPSLSAFSNGEPFPRFAYPAIDTKMFIHSVQSFHPLIEQVPKLLERLSDPAFAQRIMEAAQQGKQSRVEELVKSIGLAVPVTTHFTPSGITFSLHSRTNEHTPCCTLSVTLKWGF